MKIYKFIFTGILITVAALFYVHQRVEIVKAGYDLQRSRRHLCYLADQNSKLRYSLSKIESPRYLLAQLEEKNIEFAQSRTKESNAYNLANSYSDNYVNKEGLFGKFLNLFIPSAEAKPRN